MATAMESAIAVLVIIAIILSAGTLYYMTDLTARIAAIEEKLPPTLTVLGPWAGKEMDAFLPVLQRFEGLTGYKVTYKTYRAEDLSPILPAQFDAGTAPGDVIFMWAWFIKEKGTDGHVLNVTGLIDEADFPAGYLKPVKGGPANETLYGGVYTGKVKPGFWYRKSFFDTNNLEPPTTWAEFEALLADIAAIVPTGVPIASGDTDGWPLTDITEHFIITYGGTQLHKDLTNGTVAWTSSQVKTTKVSKYSRNLHFVRGGAFCKRISWVIVLVLISILVAVPSTVNITAESVISKKAVVVPVVFLTEKAFVLPMPMRSICVTGYCSNTRRASPLPSYVSFV